MESFENLQYEYHLKESAIRDLFSMVSIQRVYNEITNPITMPSKYVINRIGFEEFTTNPDIAENVEKPSLWEILGGQMDKNYRLHHVAGSVFRDCICAVYAGGFTMILGGAV